MVDAGIGNVMDYLNTCARISGVGNVMGRR